MVPAHCTRAAKKNQWLFCGKVSQIISFPSTKNRENSKFPEQIVKCLVSGLHKEYNSAAWGPCPLRKERALMAEHKSKVNTVLLVLFRILFTFFAVLSTAFIFYNSLEIGMASAQRSTEIAALINGFLGKFGISPLSGFAIRKLAHFSEFALLGFWWTLCLRVYTRHYIRHISWPLFLVSFTACVDETIQTYVIDRSGSIRDVWIDFSGGCVGILCGLMVVLLFTGFWYALGLGRKRE
jgi:hypothetical protein